MIRKWMVKLCLVLACLLALGCAAAEEAPAAHTVEDFSGLWELNTIVEEGLHMNVKAWGLQVLLSLHEDGSAYMIYSVDDIQEMSWRFEDGHAYITGYSAGGEVEMAFYMDGSLILADEVGEMYFSRYVAEEEAAE